MSVVELTAKNLEIANNQIVARVGMRDNVLLVYLGAAGTIYSIALGTSANKEILLTIPFLTLGCSVIVSHHNILIGALLDFCSKEIRGFIRNTHPDKEVPQFDCSDSFKKYLSATLRLRTWGHAIILVIPAIVALACNWDHALGAGSVFPYGPVWWFALAFSVGSVYIIFSVSSLRAKFEERFENEM